MPTYACAIFKVRVSWFSNLEGRSELKVVDQKTNFEMVIGTEFKQGHRKLKYEDKIFLLRKKKVQELVIQPSKGLYLDTGYVWFASGSRQTIGRVGW